MVCVPAEIIGEQNIYYFYIGQKHQDESNILMMVSMDLDCKPKEEGELCKTTYFKVL